MRDDGVRKAVRRAGRVGVACLASGVAAVTLGNLDAAFAHTGGTTSAEYPVAAHVPGVARFDQATPAVAANGDGYLVAWTQSRFATRGPDGQIRASRLDPDGVPLDTFGFDVSDIRGVTPSVAWNKGVYLVVWHQMMPEAGYPYPNLVPDVYGARVASDGTVLDPGGFPIATGEGSRQEHPVVAPLGDGFVVAFQDGRLDGRGTRAARVTAAGTVLDPQGIDVSVEGAAVDYGSVGVASNGAVALISWVDRRAGNADIRATRLGAEGAVIGGSSAALTTTPTDERMPTVAANGTDFLVSWEDTRGDVADVYAARVSGSGSVLDPGGFRVSEVSSVRPQPTAASDGSGYAVSWVDWRHDRSPNQVRARRVGADGTFSDSSSFVAGNPAGYSSIGSAWGPEGYLVSWSNYVDGSDVFANIVPRSGFPAAAGGVLLSTEPNQQLDPEADWDGTNYLVAWSDTRFGSDIYAGRVAADGTSLDGSGILVANAELPQVEPEVVWNGSLYFVVWRDYRTQNAQVYAARVSRDGQVLDPNGFLVSLPNYDISWTSFGVAAGGSDLMVAWSGYDYDTGGTGIYASTVSAAGAVVDHVLVANEGSVPDVAWNGRSYLVSWLGPDDDRNVYGLGITRGKPDRQSVTISAGPAWKMAPEVASDGNDFFVAWADDRSGGMEVYGARVSANGKLLDPQGIAVVGTSEFSDVSGVVWDGHHYVVSSRLNLVRVTCDAVVVDPDGIPVETSTPWRVRVTDVAAGPSGDVALLLHRTIPEPPYNDGARALIRFFHEPTGTAAEESAAGSVSSGARNGQSKRTTRACA